MAKDSNIVHQYFKKELKDAILLVKVNPLHLRITEITVYKDQDPDLREIDVDENIIEDLKTDGFTEASPLEFNLYLSGLLR
jgi:predicted translin family RNA/ssDNA-binding protein